MKSKGNRSASSCIVLSISISVVFIVGLRMVMGGPETIRPLNDDPLAPISDPTDHILDASTIRNLQSAELCVLEELLSEVGAAFADVEEDNGNGLSKHWNLRICWEVEDHGPFNLAEERDRLLTEVWRCLEVSWVLVNPHLESHKRGVAPAVCGALCSIQCAEMITTDDMGARVLIEGIGKYVVLDDSGSDMEVGGKMTDDS